MSILKPTYGLIHCPTQLEYTQVSIILERDGFTWGSPPLKPTQVNNWLRYESGTYISIASCSLLFATRNAFDTKMTVHTAVDIINQYGGKTAPMCPDCKDTKQYVSLLFITKCPTCCKE